ncbi:MAG: tRNA (pseudouridine(54)-N(1))-methyltransferase TrmY [Candidatus Bipolaricaulia bacterium]
MRRFVILGHKVPLEATFSLNDLPGGAGRLDVLCRAIGASLFVSHGIRSDVEAILLLQNTAQIRIAGDRVKRLNPDERSTAALIKRALDALSDEEVQSTPGIFVSRRSLPETLDRLHQLEANPVVLHEGGTPVDAFSFPRNPAFVLSDHVDFTEEEDRELGAFPHVSLGEKPLHTSQCITIMHYLLDQREEAVDQDLKLCHIVSGEPKARLISNLLEDFDIPVNLVTHVPPSVLPVTFDGLADVRIMVRPRDFERAQQIITDYFESPIDD